MASRLPKQRLVLGVVALAVLIGGLLSAVTFFLLQTGVEGGTAPQDRIATVVMIGLVGLGLGYAALRELVVLFVRPPLQLTEEIGLLLNDCSRRVRPRGSAELQRLATAINDLATARELRERDVQGQIRAAQASVEDEKNRLAALMSDLHQSVVVCNLDGRILLYNQRARSELAVEQEDASELLGLGRSVYAIFDRGLIAHALENLRQRIGREEAPTSQFVTATPAGRLLRVHLAPVRGGGEAAAAPVIAGFVLILEDITATFEHDSRRDAVIHTLTEGARGPLGSIRAAADMLWDYPDMDAEERKRFLGVIRDESRRLTQQLESTGSDYSDTLKSRWPVEAIRGADFVDAVVRRISQRTGLPAKIEAVDDSIWIKVDSFALMQAVTYLAARLEDEYSVREVRVGISEEGPHAHLDLIWSGTALSTETVMFWEMEPMKSGGEETPLTVRDVIERCNGEIWFERQRASHRAFFRILLPRVEAHSEGAEGLSFVHSASRPEYYDFDIFRWSDGGHELDDRPLSELSYTVFDTETTGLEPSKGDEIIQIGATRIVNRRLLHHEGYEKLIDPRRPLPAASVKIHGITEDMLRGQPHILEVLPGFHAYCTDTILVAHNAAFDMRFLQLKEKESGLVFGQPVLDTLLLSAVLHPNQESHRLEEIADRFGITVIGRHTALGDAIVTGEVFLRMIPLLEEMGIRTLRQAREASEKTYYARLRY